MSGEKKFFHNLACQALVEITTVFEGRTPITAEERENFFENIRQYCIMFEEAEMKPEHIKVVQEHLHHQVVLYKLRTGLHPFYRDRYLRLLESCIYRLTQRLNEIEMKAMPTAEKSEVDLLDTPM